MSDKAERGIAAYNLASMLVVAWRKTGLTTKQLIALIEELMRNDAAKRPQLNGMLHCFP